MTPTPPTYYTSTDRRCTVSALEQRVLDDLVAAGLPIVPQVKRKSWVFDAGVQGTWILIEVNGAYWHNKPEAKARDARKALWCEQVGYTLVVIQEADYLRDAGAAVAPAIAAYRAAQPAPLVQTGQTPDTHAPSVSGDSSIPPIEIIPGPGDWAGPFLAALSETGIVLDACQRARVSRATAYARRENDPHFDQAWKYALQDAADIALRAYRLRGMEQSDRAIEFFIKSRDPESYRTEDITIHIDWGMVPDALLEAFRAGRVPFEELRPYAVRNMN